MLEATFRGSKDKDVPPCSAKCIPFRREARFGHRPKASLGGQRVAAHTHIKGLGLKADGVPEPVSVEIGDA